MTVAELIRELEKYPADENVLIAYDCSYGETRDVYEVDDEVVITA